MRESNPALRVKGANCVCHAQCVRLDRPAIAEWRRAASLVRRALQYSSPEPAAVHPEHLG